LQSIAALRSVKEEKGRKKKGGGEEKGGPRPKIPPCNPTFALGWYCKRGEGGEEKKGKRGGKRGKKRELLGAREAFCFQSDRSATYIAKKERGGKGGEGGGRRKPAFHLRVEIVGLPLTSADCFFPRPRSRKKKGRGKKKKKKKKKKKQRKKGKDG